LLALLEQTEERMSVECRSIALQKEVVQSLILELDDTSSFAADALKYAAAPDFSKPGSYTVPGIGKITVTNFCKGFEKE
jgi:hypothetical protein